MLAKIWSWIELVVMIVGFIYVLILVIAFTTMMIPILILFETTKTKRIGE